LLSRIHDSKALGIVGGNNCSRSCRQLLQLFLEVDGADLPDGRGFREGLNAIFELRDVLDEGPDVHACGACGNGFRTYRVRAARRRIDYRFSPLADWSQDLYVGEEAYPGETHPRVLPEDYAKEFSKEEIQELKDTGVECVTLWPKH